MIIVYSRPQCGPCHTLLYWLEKKGIAFEERPPADWVKIFPSVEIDGQRVEGLNILVLSRLLNSRSQ